MTNKAPTRYAIGETENITARTVDEAVKDYLAEFYDDGEPGDFLPDTLTVQGYATAELQLSDFSEWLENMVRDINEEYGPQEDPSEYQLSDAARGKWEAFVDQVIAEYPVYSLDCCGEPIVVNVIDYTRGLNNET